MNKISAIKYPKKKSVIIVKNSSFEFSIALLRNHQNQNKQLSVLLLLLRPDFRHLSINRDEGQEFINFYFQRFRGQKLGKSQWVAERVYSKL